MLSLDQQSARPMPHDVEMIEQRDLVVRMRDGVRLSVDVYRPVAHGRYPVLYASAPHNKDLQGPDIAEALPPQPAFAPLWFGPLEAGDTRRFVANGRRLRQTRHRFREQLGVGNVAEVRCQSIDSGLFGSR
jgi:predicted acyl esterase